MQIKTLLKYIVQLFIRVTKRPKFFFLILRHINLCCWRVWPHCSQAKLRKTKMWDFLKNNNLTLYLLWHNFLLQHLIYSKTAPIHPLTGQVVLSSIPPCKRAESHTQQGAKNLARCVFSWLLLFLFCSLLFSVVHAGLRDSVCRALVGERVRLPADQPEAVRPAGGADRLGRTPGLLALRPLPDRQWETKVQVRLCSRGPGAGLMSLTGPGTHRLLFIHHNRLFFSFFHSLILMAFTYLDLMVKS